MTTVRSDRLTASALVAILAAAACGPASAALREMTLARGVTQLDVDADDDSVVVAARIQSLLDAGARTVVTGRPEVLAAVRPGFVQAWPSTSTVILDPGAGLGIFGFDAPDPGARESAISHWPWSETVETSSSVRTPRTAVPRIGTSTHHAEFDIVARSPWQVCRSFSANMMGRVFGSRTPSVAERTAFRVEARRWCQYGHVSAHLAQAPHFTVGNYRESPASRLSLVTEWALVRSEDRSDEQRTSYLFWTKTVGDGAGSGFTQEGGRRAWFDPARRELRDIMDVAIHSGWGDIDPPDVTTAWPANSSFPDTGDVFLFRCDGPLAFRPTNCPLLPLLRKLYPDDSFDGKLTLSHGESLTYGGEFKVSRGLDTDGKVSTTFSFGMQAIRGTEHTSQLDVALTQTRSNAGAVFYRSTWWTPDIYAIYRWLAAREQSPDLAKATPLATTLNPRYEILWELPLAVNAGRALPYHVVYEMGLNACNAAVECTRSGSALGERAKARVGWVDGVTIFLPDE